MKFTYFRSSTLLLSRAGLGAAFVAIFATSALAAPLYRAGVSHDGSYVNSCSGLSGGTSSSPVTATTACDGQGSGTAIATAFPGHVGAQADAVDLANGNFVTSASAFETGDVVLTGNDPSAPPGTTHLSVNLDFNGGLGATHDGGAEVRFEVTLFGNLIGTALIQDSGGVITCNASVAGITACGPSFGGPIISQALLVPLNAPIQLALLLEVSAGGGGINESGNANYLSSLDLPVGRDVFNLADGVNANSADFSIVDNRFTPSGTSVPEPSTWSLLGIGFVTVGILAKRRRQFG
jgi:PEP-CTERM motif